MNLRRFKEALPEGLQNLAVATVLLAILGGFYYYNMRSQNATSPDSPATKASPTAALPPPMPGWNEIGDCSPFTSGVQTLKFFKDGKLEIHNNLQKPTLLKSGTWNYDSTLDRFHTLIEGETNSYFLLLEVDDTVCILASGETSSANLDTAWFARVDDDED